MKKRLLSSVLVLSIIISMFCIFPTSSQAINSYYSYFSYPEFWISRNWYEKVGSKVEIDASIRHVYNYEKLIINIYNSKNELVANLNKSFDNRSLWVEDSFRDYTFVWNTKGYKPGKYTIVSNMKFYSDLEWHTCPLEKSDWISLYKPVPSIKSAKNIKGKKIKLSWKKIAPATKYQVKIGKKKYTTKKTKFTSKKLNYGKTYNIKVRAYINKKWNKWCKAKKIKIKK